MNDNVWPRRIAIVAALVVAGYGAKIVLKKLFRSDANKALEARQDLAREKIGDGFDDLFEAQLDADNATIRLDAVFTMSSELGGRHAVGSCANGFEQAFADALGPDVIAVSDSDFLAMSAYPIALVATVTKTDRSFVLPSSRESFPGISLAGDIKLGGKTVHVEVEPGEDISFEYSRMTLDTSAISGTEVAAGVLQATCKEAGYVLLEKLTTWKRPAATKPVDPVADCERGFHCVESGDALAKSDPAKAEKLYATACMTKDAEACSRLAGLVVGAPGKTDQAQAQVALEMSCSQDVGIACVGGAMVAQLRQEPNQPPSAFQKAEALVMALRGCDLGERDACEMAAPLVEGTPFAEGGPLLLGSAPVKSKRMGTVFGLHWGQWHKMDRGQATLWVTKRPPGEFAIAREFAVGELPKGITAPPGVSTVYALAQAAGHGEYDVECTSCNPSGGGDSIYSMRAFDCVCVISRER